MAARTPIRVYFFGVTFSPQKMYNEGHASQFGKLTNTAHTEAKRGPLGS